MEPVPGMVIIPNRIAGVDAGAALAADDGDVQPVAFTNVKTSHVCRVRLLFSDIKTARESGEENKNGERERWGGDLNPAL